MKYWFIGLFVLWMSVQAAFLLLKGVNLPVDSARYLAGAEGLLAGRMPEGPDVWYTSYMAFLASVFFLGGTESTAIAIQIIFSGLAAYCVYSIAVFVFADRHAGVVSVILFLLWLKIHEWNVILYTESLFTSFVIISFACVIHSSRWWHHAFVLVLVFFTIFIRPNGFAFLIGFLAYYVSSIRRERSNLASLLVMAGVGAMVWLMALVQGFDVIDSYRKAEIIYPNMTLGMSAPADLYVPVADHSFFYRLIEFAIHNPVYFFKITLVKLLLFWANIKPYYSITHVAAIVMVLYPMYFFAINGLYRLRCMQSTKHFVLAFVSAQSALVALTTENWDGRFLIPLLPFICIMAAGSIVRCFHLYRTKQSLPFASSELSD